MMQFIEVVTPYLRAEGEPRFPVTAPINLLRKLLNCGGSVAFERSRAAFLFGDQPMPDGRGKARHVRVSRDKMITVARITSR